MDTVINKFQALIDEQNIVGLALAVVRYGEIVYSQGMGVTGVEDYQLPVTLDTLFAIGSISKTVAAVTILRLVEQNLLDLDRPVVEYLDGFDFDDVANGRKVTLRHLLSHSSGIAPAGRYWGLRGRDALRQFVREDLRYHRFMAAPGQVYCYNSTAISAVAYIAEVVTQTPYPALVRQLIFDPLEMRRSSYDLATVMTYPLALAHQPDEDGALHVIHRMTDNDMGHGSSFCYCSTLDLARFAAALIEPGKLLTADSLHEMRTPVISQHVEGANYPGALWGAGFGIGIEIGTHRGIRKLRHGGQNLSNNCYLELFPDQRVAVVLQTNYMADERGFNVLFDLFDHLLSPTAPLRPPAPPELPYTANSDLAGEYLNPTDGIQAITVADGRLLLNGEDVLVCVGDGQFYYQDGTLRFPVAFPLPDTMILRGLPYFRLTRDAFEPDLSLWQSYAGAFVDPFTPYPEEFAIQVRFGEGGLWINDRPQEVLSNSRFLSSDGLFEFLGPDMLQVRMGTRFVRSRQD